MKKLALLFTILFFVTSCGTMNNENPNINTNNNTSAEEDKELMNNEDFKLHIASNDAGQEMEAVMQKNGNDISVEFIKLAGMEDMPMDMKMKKMLVKDNAVYTNMEVSGEDIWIQGEYDQEAQDELGFIDIKKLLKKIKEENAEKTSKEIEGKNYDCYSGEFLDGTEMCFDGDDLKYILDDGYSMQIIEYTDKIDKSAFAVPADNAIKTQEEFMQIMMGSMQ